MTFKEWFTNRGDSELGAKLKAATMFRLSDNERAETRDTLRAYMRVRPYQAPNARSVPKKYQHLFYPMPVFAFALSLVVIGGTAGAAELALPGDFLYPIKINVNEEVRAAIAPTPAAKAKVAIARAETRIKELETLEGRGVLDENERGEIEERLDTQVRAAEEKTLELDDENGERVTREERLVAVLRAHESLIASEQIEIGGSLEPEVPLEEVIAADMGISAATHAPEVMTMSIAVPSPADTAISQETVRTAPTPEPLTVVKEEKTEKKNQGFNEKTVNRQKKAAGERIDALERLVKRMEKRVVAESIAAAQTSLADAEAAFETGEVVFTEKNLSEASFHFNIALKIAIDARETLTHAPLIKKTAEKRGENTKKKNGRGEQNIATSSSLGNDSEAMNEEQGPGSEEQESSGRGGSDDSGESDEEDEESNQKRSRFFNGFFNTGR